jgi:hypothetical protein
MTDTLIILYGSMMVPVAIFVLILVSHLAATIARIDRRLDLLVRHAGIDIWEVAMREAQTLLRAGRKVEAVKRYREYLGVSLADAKRAIEETHEGAGPA